MRTLLLASILLLAGCASSPSIYNPEALSSEELAHVKWYEPPWMEGGHRATITRVFDESKNVVIDTSFGEVHTEVTLEPGTYYFLHKCDDGFTYSFPQSVATLEAGEEYTMFCERIIEEDAILGLDQIRGNRVRIVKSSEFSPEIIQHSRYKEE
jgi:hypothetical protein